MITITVQEEKLKFQQTFHKNKIIIGKGALDKVDLPLHDPHLSENHLQIIIKNGRYRILNTTHDPAVSLNSLAFGTRSLRKGDMLLINGAALHIDNLAAKPTIEERSSIEENDEEIESLLKEVDALGEPAALQEEGASNPLQVKQYNPFHFAGIAVCTLLILLGSGIYMALVNDQLEINETEASLFVADAGMALSYAKLYAIQAPRENWSSPQFLKESIAKLIAAPDTSTLESLTPDGWLKNTPYLIRVYTSKNLKRFLIIAQPSSQKSQYFSSKSAIVLDSETMELRKLENIISLNRLLSNPKSLDNENGETITSMVRSGKLITLKNIGIEKKRPELIPPRGLGFIRPGADLKVYNTPRYYPLTEWVVKEASRLRIPENGVIDILPPFFQELQRLAPFKDLVYYTTEEMREALHAYEVFHIYLPDEEMLIGQLSLSPTSGLVQDSLLITLKGAPHSQNEQVEASELATVTASNDLDKHSKWFEELNNLRSARTRHLEILEDAMSRLLLRHTREADPNFEGKFEHLHKSYFQVDKELQSSISQKIFKLYKDYRIQEPGASPNRFLEYVKMTGLEFFADTGLINLIEQDEINQFAMKKNKQ